MRFSLQGKSLASGTSVLKLRLTKLWRLTKTWLWPEKEWFETRCCDTMGNALFQMNTIAKALGNTKKVKMVVTTK